MNFKEYYEGSIEEESGAITKDLFSFHLKRLFRKVFNKGVEIGLKKGKESKESYESERQKVFEKALRKSMFIEMISLLAEYENDYLALQTELNKRIHKKINQL